MGILAICDNDEGYVRCLTEYFLEKGRLPFSIYGFSKERELLEFSKKNRIKILLISTGMLSDEIRNANADKIVVLSDGGMVGEAAVNEYDTIFKFQSTENIIHEVMGIYSDMQIKGITEADVPGRQPQGDVWGVYSPVSRCGKTTFAVALGQALAQEERVLYINMDEFSGFGTLCSRQFSGDLSDVLYYQKLNPAGLGSKLRAIVSNIHGLDIVAPMSFSSDLREVGYPQWKELIEYVTSQCGYDRVILDINNVVKNPIKLLPICSKIFMPMHDDMISAARVREFEHYLIRSGNEQILFNIQKIKPPYIKEHFMQEGYMDRLLLSGMGEFVNNVLKGGVRDGDRSLM